jgi:hypothetical protein
LRLPFRNHPRQRRARQYCHRPHPKHRRGTRSGSPPRCRPPKTSSV